MWEFDIIDKETQETNIIFGYTLADAFRRHPRLNPSDWECVRADYID